MMKLRDHVDQSWMIRLLFLLLVVINASYYCYAINNNEFLLIYDCKVGCDLDISVNGDIVCGSDNNVYPNECFAVCQNVKVVKKGPCTSTADRSRIAVNDFSSSAVQTGFIPIEKIKQYENDGYKMIRRWDYSKLNGQVKVPKITNDILKQMQMNVNSSLKQTSFSYTPSMINSEGYEYIGNGIDFSIEDSVKGVAPQLIAGYNPHLDDPKKYNNTNINRKLQVLGSDDRTQIRNTDTFPYSAFGALGYTPDNIICSGTVIYRNAVLTAAHCVYDAGTEVWAPLSYFAPGRGKDGIEWNDPYGTWPVDFMLTTKPAAYNNSQNWGDDFAIVKLKPNSNGEEIGDVVGYAGLAESSDYDDPDLDQSTITGYPGDLGGRSMWTAGTHPSGFVNGSDWGFDSRVALHALDATGGGSSLMHISGANYYARGVHVFRPADPVAFPWHGANVFFQGNGMFDVVELWSGRPPTPRTPNPTPRPSGKPSRKPSSSPLKRPSAKPSVKPSKKPSSSPSNRPSAKPSVKPSKKPSSSPSNRPSAKPSVKPSKKPSSSPTKRQSAKPSVKPSKKPSSAPSRVPLKRPSAKPSVIAAPRPTPIAAPRPTPIAAPRPTPIAALPTPSVALPTPSAAVPNLNKPSSKPSHAPSFKHSHKPSAPPTLKPSRKPSSKPSHAPGFKPSHKPSSRDRCVDNENELRFAISDAGASRIDVCSSYIQIDASLPNLMGIQGIQIKNKLLSIYCMAAEMCILDAQHLSRMFAVWNSTLYFQDFMFINSDVSQDSLYKSGGAFYIKDSTIEMLNCGFVNNVAANFGGGMVVLKSNLTIYGSDNAISFTRIEGNRATTNGGFISSDSSNIKIYNHNFLYNSALYGGVFNIKNSILTIISNDSDTANKIHHNAATVDGGFICAYSNSIIEIDNYIFLNNTATNGAGGDAFLVQDSALTLKVRDDLTIPTTFEIEKNNINIL